MTKTQKHDDTTKPERMGVKEFRQLGLLQEVNRQMLHPLGMALEVIIEEDGTERFGLIWDYRSDPEGIVYREDVDLEPKAECLLELQSNAHPARLERLGFVIQPAEKVGK